MAMTVSTLTPDAPPSRLGSAEVVDREYRGRKIRPLAAFRAFRRLIRDKEDTVQVFEIMKALTGNSSPRGYIKLTRRAGGIAFARTELAERFSDKAWLAGFAKGSVGTAYREFMARENLSAAELARDNRLVTPFIDAPHVYAWYARRVRDVHDVWHVLTGYGRDPLGEACLVAFSYAQTKGLGWALIAFGALTRARGPGAKPYRVAIREGFRRGRASAWLPGEDYERLLAEPLEVARRRLGLAPPIAYEAIPPQLRNGERVQAAAK